MIIQPVPEVTIQQVDMLDDTERGEEGFGSSGM
jgi:dUTPase